MDNIIERLEELRDLLKQDIDRSILQDAIDEIKRLREALKIFAIYADYLDEDYGDYPDHYVSKGFQGNIIVFGDFRNARAALKEGE